MRTNRTSLRQLIKLILLLVSYTAISQNAGSFDAPVESVISIPDTIKVVTHNREVIVTDPSQGVNHYPLWGIFPGMEVPVRKIMMKVTFGCPDTMRCADWDYLDHIILERKGGKHGERLGWEIGRIITPYGGFFSPDWHFSWEVDVTDFSMVLRDSVEINYIHSGYEPNDDRGWLVTIEFLAITGTPSLLPVSITEIYNHHFPYGDSNFPIEDSLRPVSVTGEERAALGRLRVTQTGHGMDRPDNCAEFCSKYREFWYDGKLWNKRQMWMECGDNPLYPQAGTWIFDRGNWCPGLLMQPEIFDLPVIPGEAHTLHFIMEPYTAAEINQGKQVISAYLIQYEKPVARFDVSVEDIIVPSDKDIHSRKNPSGANPQVVIKNNGSEPVNKLTIEYGTAGFDMMSHQWTGSLNPGEKAVVILPGVVKSNKGLNRFQVSLINPNGMEDEYPADDGMESLFTPAPVHGSSLIFYLLTNNEPGHNGWQLLSGDGRAIMERPQGSLTARTVYLDTFRLAPGPYQLILSDTAGDGLEFWFNAKGGRGEARLMDGDKNLIKSFESDCGSGWIYNFSVGENPDPVNPDDRAISLYPARTSDKTTLRYFSNRTEDVLVRLTADPGGEIVEERKYPALKEGAFDFDLKRFPYGRFYLKVIVNEEEVFNKRIRFIEPPKDEIPHYEWPTDPLVSGKLHQWQDWKFGVLIHWGPYSEWGVVESWSLCPEDEGWCVRRGPFADDYHTYTKEYEKIREIFNPEKFDPAKWAAACSKAGMKYVVFTTKHHDGFCMFDTKYTDYKITDEKSAFSQNPKSNIVNEVFHAFREKGMGTGAYFSKPDWHNDDYWWPYFPVFDRNVNYDPSKYPERWKHFQDFTYNQLEELMTGYGKVDILWLDGGWVRPEGTLTEETRPWLGKNQWIQDINMPEIASMARKHQPGLLIVDRTVHGDFENYRTPEHQVPDQVLDHPWESCIPLGDNWYTTGPGETYKSASWVIHTLVRIVARGGNFLLGIGPDKSGEMVPEVYDRLEEIGRWMDVNAAAIYNTKPLAPHQEGSIFFTQSEDEKTRFAIYLVDEHEELPQLVRIPEGFAGDLKEIELLGYPKKLKVNQADQSVSIPASFRKSHAGGAAIVFLVKST
jgi:alpha-L-fucosidase